MDQFFQMSDTAGCWCVWKADNIFFFQGNSLYLNKCLTYRRFHVKIEPGIPVSLLSLYSNFFRKKISGCCPFFCCLIRGLGIHVDPAAGFIYTDQIVFRLSGRIITFLQDDFCIRNKKFSAPAGVLYMDCLKFITYLNMGDKTVRTIFKNTSDRISVFHIIYLAFSTITQNP